MSLLLHFRKIQRRISDNELLKLQSEISSEVERRSINDANSKQLAGKQ
jgi:hypothetical protein